jgi:hypothetical protein
MPRKTSAARADFTTHRDMCIQFPAPASTALPSLQVECFQVRAGGGGGCGDRISVWPPPLRERPRRRWERHEHSSWTRPQCNLNEPFINATSARVSHGQCMYTASGNLADSDVRGTHVSPGSVGTTSALQSKFELPVSVLSLTTSSTWETDNRRADVNSG